MTLLFWFIVALFQTCLGHFSLLIPLQKVASLSYGGALGFIERTHSPWNWFYEAILIGHDEGLRSQDEMRSFFVLGLYHLIVVSGSHVVALEHLVQRLTFYLPRRFQKLLTIAVLIGFSLVNRLQASCMRAVVQWFFMSGLKKSRLAMSLHPVDMQLVVTLLCLAIAPEWAHSLSFQLSCAASFGMAVASLFELRKPFFQRTVTTLCCTLLTAPLVMCLQPCLSWLIIPANTIAMPLFEGILMPVSFLNVLVPWVSRFGEALLQFVFSLGGYFSAFDHPQICLDQRRLQSWGLLYLGFLYFCVRFSLPWLVRRRFWRSQRAWSLEERPVN